MFSGLQASKRVGPGREEVVVVVEVSTSVVMVVVVVCTLEIEVLMWVLVMRAGTMVEVLVRVSVVVDVCSQ
jgi:hypothetical protein